MTSESESPKTLEQGQLAQFLIDAQTDAEREIVDPDFETKVHLAVDLVLMPRPQTEMTQEFMAGLELAYGIIKPKNIESNLGYTAEEIEEKMQRASYGNDEIKQECRYSLATASARQTKRHLTLQKTHKIVDSILRERQYPGPQHFWYRARVEEGLVKEWRTMQNSADAKRISLAGSQHPDTQEEI